MKFEKRIKENRFEKGKWRPPTFLKIALFKVDKGRFSFRIRLKPLILIYLFIPRLFKFWFSIECEVFSIMYNAFMKYPDDWGQLNEKRI